jgi:hypothetical protein
VGNDGGVGCCCSPASSVPESELPSTEETACSPLAISGAATFATVPSSIDEAEADLATLVSSGGCSMLCTTPRAESTDATLAIAAGAAAKVLISRSGVAALSAICSPSVTTTRAASSTTDVTTPVGCVAFDPPLGELPVLGSRIAETTLLTGAAAATTRSTTAPAAGSEVFGADLDGVFGGAVALGARAVARAGSAGTATAGETPAGTATAGARVGRRMTVGGAAVGVAVAAGVGSSVGVGDAEAGGGTAAGTGVTVAAAAATLGGAAASVCFTAFATSPSTGVSSPPARALPVKRSASEKAHSSAATVIAGRASLATLLSEMPNNAPRWAGLITRCPY